MEEAPLAYKFVALAVMLGEINYHAARLQLPIEVPVRPQEIRREMIDQIPSKKPDWVVQVKNYWFIFSGDLSDIRQLDDHGRSSFNIPRGADESELEAMERSSHRKSLINTNEAWHLATNWLASLDVDLNELARQNVPTVKQGEFHSNRGLVPSPHIVVEWKNPAVAGYDSTTVYMILSSFTGELMELRLRHIPYGREHQALVHDLDKLKAISNAEFLKYSPAERTNLVARFSAVQHPAPVPFSPKRSPMEAPLAYQFVARNLMLAEINYYAARMHLPMALPVTAQDIQVEVVAPPVFHEFEARLMVKGYQFNFSGSLHSVVKQENLLRRALAVPGVDGESLDEFLERLSHMKFNVSTNDALHAATNWLAAMDIDLPKLEKQYHLDFNPIRHQSKTLGLVTVPWYRLEWHTSLGSSWGATAVTVEISAVTGDLLAITQDFEDAVVYTKEPLPLIKEYDTLAAISDEEFLKYSPLEQSNLVVRFSNLQHPSASPAQP